MIVIIIVFAGVVRSTQREQSLENQMTRQLLHADVFRECFI